MTPPPAGNRSPKDGSAEDDREDGRPGDPSARNRSSNDCSANDRSEDIDSIAAALGATGRVLYARPGAILPAYLLALGAIQIALVPAFLGFAVALASLWASGRLDALSRELSALADAAESAGDSGTPGSSPNPANPTGTGAGEGIPPGVIEALTGLFTPLSVGVVGFGIAGAVLAYLLARAVTTAISQGTVWAALDGRAPLAEGLSIAGRWRTFFGLTVLRVGVPVLALFPAALVALAAGGLLLTGAAASGGGTIFLGVATLLAVLLAAGGVFVGVLTQFLLLFAGPAVVVDDRDAFGAARASLGFVRSEFGSALAFGLLVIGGYLSLLVLAALLSSVGAARVLAPLVPLGLAPLLDTSATALYAGRVDPTGPADATDSVDSVRRSVTPLRVRAGRALRRAIADLVGFPRAFPLATLLGGLCLAGAIAAGYFLTVPYEVTVGPPGEVGNVFGAFPIGTFATLAVNNWVVSARLAFGGFAFGLPAIVGLTFNGLLVGGLAGVSDPLTFLALVAPHGILELPTIALAGGIGLHLGRVGWNALRGRTDVSDVAAELKRASVLLFGIALLLIVAAFIEAFLTPQVAAAIVG